MKRSHFLIAFLLSLPLLASAKTLTLAQFTKKPKLVVTIVIDQCRSDFLTRFEKRMRAQKGGGLQYLMKNGAYFPFAKYDIMQSMTCPGHATILTGSYPYQMGIPLNEWYDTVNKTDVYCAEDHNAAIVGRDAKPEEGMSPRRLIGSTVGDELKIAGYKSKVVTVALKDRSAIMMGGHRADLAMWVEEGKWVSSKYYLADGKLPAWVVDLNAGLEKEKGTTFKWKVAGVASGLTEATAMPTPAPVANAAAATLGAATAAAPDGVAGEPSVAKAVDHSRETIAGSKESFATQYGVRVTTQAAIRALKEFKLGLGVTPDILAVSYSSHDMLGHEKGLQAPVMEELTMAEDESIGELLRAIDKQVGLKNVVFAFTGDHGVAPPATLMKEKGMPAGAFDVKALLAELNASLEEKWGKSSKGPWIMRLKSLNLYLDPAVMADKKKDRAEVENEVKRLLLKPRANGENERDGVAQVFTRTEWENRKLPAGRWERQILKTYIPGKNGEVVLIPKSFWVDANAFATHLTGYNYDRSVPLIIAGGGATPGVYAKEVEVVDLAPTLSFMLGLVAPSGSDGRVLHEIFEK